MGAIRNFVELNNDDKNNCIFCVVDLHAITVKQDPKELRDNIRETVATFVGCGINPEKVLFSVSRVFQPIRSRLVAKLYRSNGMVKPDDSI